MAVILAHPAADAARARRARRAARDIPLPPPRPRAAAPPKRPRSLLLLGFVPLLLANASWDAVTFLGGTHPVTMGAHARPAAQPSASTCA